MSDSSNESALAREFRLKRERDATEAAYKAMREASERFSNEFRSDGEIRQGLATAEALNAIGLTQSDVDELVSDVATDDFADHYDAQHLELLELVWELEAAAAREDRIDAAIRNLR
jgi:hypothetical protein